MPRYFSGKGDAGETDLFSGRKLPKDSPVLELIGVIDELSAQIGFAKSFVNPPIIRKNLQSIQVTLSKMMSLIAGVSESVIGDFDIGNEITRLEGLIVEYGSKLDPPDRFTFFGDTSSGAALNICRTEARKAERRALAYSRENSNFDHRFIAYLNRLSSLLFVFSKLFDQPKIKN